ncbi:hypothetical protein [Burkholderia thailandensis]|nr:hypothetical protein [Burkholderia thailandensis]
MTFEISATRHEPCKHDALDRGAAVEIDRLVETFKPRRLPAGFRLFE